jgi:hypothetical protein
MGSRKREGNPLQTDVFTKRPAPLSAYGIFLAAFAAKTIRVLF